MKHATNAATVSATEAATASNETGAGQDIVSVLAAPCEMRLRQSRGTFTLYLAELGLSVSGENLQTVHAELMAQREMRLRKFAAENILSWLPRPDEAAQLAPSALVQLKPFFIKASVILLLILGTLGLIGQGLNATGKALEKNVREVSNWTPEKMESQRRQAHAFAERFRPVARELLLMFRDAPEENAEGVTKKLETAAKTDGAGN